MSKWLGKLICEGTIDCYDSSSGAKSISCRVRRRKKDGKIVFVVEGLSSLFKLEICRFPNLFSLLGFANLPDLSHSSHLRRVRFICKEEAVYASIIANRVEEVTERKTIGYKTKEKERNVDKVRKREEEFVSKFCGVDSVMDLCVEDFLEVPSDLLMLAIIEYNFVFGIRELERLGLGKRWLQLKQRVSKINVEKEE